MTKGKVCEAGHKRENPFKTELYDAEFKLRTKYTKTIPLSWLDVHLKLLQPASDNGFRYDQSILMHMDEIKAF